MRVEENPYRSLPRRMAIGYITFCSISLLSYISIMSLVGFVSALLQRCSFPLISCEQRDQSGGGFLLKGLLVSSLVLLSVLALASIKNRWALNQCPRPDDVDDERFLGYKKGVVKDAVSGYFYVMVSELIFAGFPVFIAPGLVYSDTYSSINMGSIAAAAWLVVAWFSSLGLVFPESRETRNAVVLRTSLLNLENRWPFRRDHESYGNLDDGRRQLLNGSPEGW